MADYYIKYGKNGRHQLVAITKHSSLLVRFTELKKGFYVQGTEKAQLRAEDVQQRGYCPFDKEKAADVFEVLRKDVQIAAPSTVGWMDYL